MSDRGIMVLALLVDIFIAGLLAIDVYFSYLNLQKGR